VSNSPVGVRLATEDDLRFVTSTWFHSVLKSGAAVNELPYGIFKLGMEANIQALLKRSTVRVAFAAEQPDEILGYCIIDAVAPNLRYGPIGLVCHHIYTKSMYRRQGVARSLLGDVKTYTHPATPGSGKKFAVALGLTYNPRLT
jgi:GNAT superfamily N-acetyltransferase